MKIYNIEPISMYRDGGTRIISVQTENGYYSYHVDFRIGSKTRGEIYYGYPENGSMIEKSLSDNIKSFLLLKALSK